MNQSNKLTSFTEAFTKLITESLYLVNQEPPSYQGMPVQPASDVPIYNSNNVKDKYQNKANYSNPLNHYVVAPSTSGSNFISTDKNELSHTELNAPTDISFPLQGQSCGKTSVNFPQSSSRPVAIDNPQKEAQTEAESVNPLLTSSKSTAARASAQAKDKQSPAAKEARASAKAKYNQSPAGKEARARANRSPAAKQARAIYSAKSHAYKKELAKSGNEEIAKQKGKEAAERKRLSLKNKSVDHFSQSSSRSVAIDNPQKGAQTEAESVNPLLTSSKGTAAIAQAKDKQSPAAKEARASAQAKYNRSSAGKKARARANAKYDRSPSAKAIRNIYSAKRYAYKKELAKSGNEEIAIQKGEEAAEKKRSSLKNKLVKLKLKEYIQYQSNPSHPE